MEEYFRKFPTIEYNNITTVDLSRNVRITDSLLRRPTIFYPYEVIAGDRPDNISYYFYEDASVDWILYLINGITDPYYDWYLDETQFNDLLTKKYGSFEKSLKTILYYRTNWASDDRKISASFYDNTLAPELKKYFAPIFGIGSKIIGYERSKDDHITNTNRVLKLEITYSSNNTFTNNEIVDFIYNSQTQGSATVISSNSSVAFIQHVNGSVNTSMTVIGEESSAQSSVSSVQTIAENITALEETYWSPVTAYDFEREKNEKNKIINTVQPEFILPIAEELRTKLGE